MFPVVVMYMAKNAICCDFGCALGGCCCCCCCCGYHDPVRHWPVLENGIWKCPQPNPLGDWTGTSPTVYYSFLHTTRWNSFVPGKGRRFFVVQCSGTVVSMSLSKLSTIFLAGGNFANRISNGRLVLCAAAPRILQNHRRDCVLDPQESQNTPRSIASG